MSKRVGVTAAEMLALREQGMSNHDIAKCLDISQQTVRNYIGRQDGRMEGLAAFKDAPARKEKAEVKPIIPKYDPKPFKESYVIGDYTIELNNDDRLFEVSSESGLIILAYEDIPDLVQFLA